MGNAASEAKTPWYKLLNGYHWLVLVVATMGWMFDCADQQFFNMARPRAMEVLLPGADLLTRKTFAGYSTSIFLIGWGTGGLILGMLGDRIGRVRTLMVTILIYSVFTGLCALSQGFWDFALYRFLTGLGVGGVFAAAVALVAETMPAGARPHALGLLQSVSAMGNVGAGLIGMGLGATAGGSAWRWMFTIGALPAMLAVVVQRRIHEPEAWVQAHAAGKASGARMGSYADLFGDARWRRHALLGMLLVSAGVLGLWGIGFFSTDLVNAVVDRDLQAAGVAGDALNKGKAFWVAVNLMMFNVGGFFGMMAFSSLAHRIGRRPAFAMGFVLGLVVTAWVYKTLDSRLDILWKTPMMGFALFTVFAGYAIYLPELFPTRLRSTGTSFCYNIGRFVAATGPITIGRLQEALKQGAGDSLEPFRMACVYATAVLLLGLVVLPFMPETRGRPLPDDGPAGR